MRPGGFGGYFLGEPVPPEERLAGGEEASHGLVPDDVGAADRVALDRMFSETYEQLRRLAATPIVSADLATYVKRVFELPDHEYAGGRLLAKVLPLVEAGRGNDRPGVRGTMWAAYNGVTEYLAYARGRDAGVRLDSLWFGAGQRLNSRALTVALDMAS